MFEEGQDFGRESYSPGDHWGNNLKKGFEEVAASC